MTNEEAIRTLRNAAWFISGSFSSIVDNAVGKKDSAVGEKIEKAVDMAVKALEAQDWIPCKERLPEVGRSVLFSRRSMVTREGCLQADGKWWQYWWYELLNADQVTAWKPLPEPYKEDENETDKKNFLQDRLAQFSGRI